jgi:hypothetical protein
MCGTHALRIPDSLISDSTCPPLWQSWPILQWKSGNRVSNFAISNALVHGPFQIPNSDARVNSLLHVTASLSLCRVSRNRDSYCNDSLACGNPEMPNPELFRILGHASFRLTALIASGNRGSRFLYARVSCLWKTRCSKCRLVQIS